MAVSIDVAYMWGIVISTFLYGVYLVMFGIALYILLLPIQPSFRARREPVNRVLVTVAVLMCITCTLHFIAQCLRMHAAYAQHIEAPGTQPPYLEDLSHPLAIVTGVCFTIAALLTDALTIYRLYMIWARNIWVCIAPAITLSGMIVCGFVMCAVTQEAGSEVMLYGTPAGYWLIATFIVGLCTNFVALGLIIARFAKRDRAQPQSDRGVGGLNVVITVIIESTAIYSGTKFINLMLLVAESNVSYTFFCIVIPVIGIASHLLIIHVGYEKYFKPLTSHGPLSSERLGSSFPMQLRSPARSPIWGIAYQEPVRERRQGVEGMWLFHLDFVPVWRVALRARPHAPAICYHDTYARSLRSPAASSTSTRRTAMRASRTI
ncbi:hypothetical protein BD626DRAFT_185230 [Schizophyllum amplum]|uniref:Uncharacterized protein n=1 Tax=Schizophyllum amplum TaxID=97359 RepID=A0A550C0T7_9AGAR|nr:hypothetical protein BD626DRAFT_185230 [Auriculariopsis ampla]